MLQIWDLVDDEWKCTASWKVSDKLSTSLVVGVVKMLHCHIVCDKLSTSLVVGVVNCHIV